MFLKLSEIKLAWWGEPLQQTFSWELQRAAGQSLAALLLQGFWILDLLVRDSDIKEVFF